MTSTHPPIKSIQDFGVLPTNDPATNTKNLQAAIDWASPRGAAIFVTPSDEPYMLDGGIILRRNVSLVGVHGPVGRGTCHATKHQPVGSVLATRDRLRPLFTVETATQLRGLQFWYPDQPLDDPKGIIEYPPTIKGSTVHSPQGVTLSCLSFFGEWLAMDFKMTKDAICEQVLIEHCYGYPLGGTFVQIDYCYDIPRLLDCHINPANRRFIDGGYSKAVIDAVVARKTFAYVIDHTDNAQVMDVFAFGTWGGAYLGPATYGQMTNFNFDCVCVGIHKLGDGDFNRNWQIAQGSIIANTGTPLKDIHPIIIEGQGHTSLVSVECFSGDNGALTCVAQSQDYLLVRGNKRCTVSIFGARMRNYVADKPITVENPNALIQAMACVDKHEKAFNLP